MLKKFLNKLVGDQNKKTLKKIAPIVAQIKEVEEKYRTEITTHEQVLTKTEEFRNRIKKGETVDKLLPEAFALVVTACRHLMGKKFDLLGNEHEWHMVPYDVQLVGGVVLHQGNIAEMKTGEGKTLVCTMPAYLNSLAGKPSFIVTVNNYLAERDAAWMGFLYKYLGLTVGVTVQGQSKEDKHASYKCNIIYGTNNELGFDYLRDNMATKFEDVAQKNLHYAIVDEVDSVLIDEARTPLLISAPAQESTEKYKEYSRLVSQLEVEKDYDIDEKSKVATLTEDGIAHLEQLLGVENVYTEKGFSEVHHVEQALRAQACYKADVDYVIKDGEIVIIDEFTGRMMPGRRYSHGLHQAIEARENVEVKRESKTLSTITFQNYFRMFDKLAGMTGTAVTESEEFYQIYALDVIEIPTHKPVIRKDSSDIIYKNREGKYKATIAKIQELHEKGQPVLVGTIHVENSELLSKFLQKENTPHKVLNAKHHAQEAEIISQAGQKGAITIATNMAGRGTDIKLGEGVTDLGGLFILGTERHESRRIDNQLRGRAGRQGDPGESQFYVSMEDDLMRMFGGERVKGMMEMLKVPDDMPIENGMISRSIEGAQKKVEGRNFDIRKHLVEYDDVMNTHRDIIFKKRREFLEKDDLKDRIIEILKETIENLVRNHTEARPQKEWNYKEIHEALLAIHKEDGNALTLGELEGIKDQEELIEKCQNYLINGYEAREKQLPDPKMMRTIEKAVFLRANDVLWMEHIDEMTRLRENVAFSGYAQKNPLMEYKSQGFEKFNEMLGLINSNTINTLFKIDLERVAPTEIIKQPEPTKIEAKKEKTPTPTLTVTRSTLEEPKEKETKNTTPSNIIKISGAPDSPENTSALQYSAGGKTETATPETTEKVGRNEPCPCGSGKKFKKCCGKNA